MLCQIDAVLVEYHGVPFARDTHDIASGKASKADLLLLVNTLPSTLSAMLHFSASTCKTTISKLDDESYGSEYLFNNPLPLYKGADPAACGSGKGGGGKQLCTLTTPPAGMTDLAFKKAIFGSIYED